MVTEICYKLPYSLEPSVVCLGQCNPLHENLEFDVDIS